MDKFLNYVPLFADNFLTNIVLGVLAFPLAMALGLLVAAGRMSPYIYWRWPAAFYIRIVRCVPEIVFVLFIYYGGQMFANWLWATMGWGDRIDLPATFFVVLALAFDSGAYQGEAFRGAFQAIPRGQSEAARAIGMSGFLTYRRILLPQAFTLAIPTLGNLWQIMIKATALAAVTGMEEVMKIAKSASAQTQQPFTYYMLTACLFLLLTAVSMVGQKKLENYANRWVRKS